jgi:hypothetical protein
LLHPKPLRDAARAQKEYLPPQPCRPTFLLGGSLLSHPSYQIEELCAVLLCDPLPLDCKCLEGRVCVLFGVITPWTGHGECHMLITIIVCRVKGRAIQRGIRDFKK